MRERWHCLIYEDTGKSWLVGFPSWSVTERDCPLAITFPSCRRLIVSAPDTETRHPCLVEAVLISPRVRVFEIPPTAKADPVFAALPLNAAGLGHMDPFVMPFGLTFLEENAVLWASNLLLLRITNISQKVTKIKTPIWFEPTGYQ